MHLFTGLQFMGLVVLWVVKSSSMALAFPFFVVGMVPYRLTFKLFFNRRELEAVSYKNCPGNGSKIAPEIIFEIVHNIGPEIVPESVPAIVSKIVPKIVPETVRKLSSNFFHGIVL